ncbi:MAG: carbohydrate kinase [Bacteroidetes bacterium]|nr:carbohydrate kinase [Bacteroidota bacterium]
MNKVPVILILDVGKTNKKILLFDEQYKLVFEENKQFEETKDEDGFPCDDVRLLTRWVKDSFERFINEERFEIRAVNFSGYGASFVYIDEDGKVSLPLYNYLKPFPGSLKEKFYTAYGGESIMSRQTASPVLGHLNSGLQIYRLKNEKPESFSQIRYALHLPQYLSYVLAHHAVSDITSIGCHTLLWDFDKKKYHRWVHEEGIAEKLAPVVNADSVAGYINKTIPVGTGVHDSSSALIPYLASFHEPFILLSTGTWCISLNPFNNIPLTDEELKQDCLCYLTYKGEPVKSSRLFAGNEHEQEIKRLASYFNKPGDYYRGVQYDPVIIKKLNGKRKIDTGLFQPGQSAFSEKDLSSFISYEEAYHQLVLDIIQQQVKSTKLVLKGTQVKKIFVDGGFSKNSIYMHLLAEAFPDLEIYAASVPQASAIGAAMAIHSYWNRSPLPSEIVSLKKFSR